MIDLTTINFQKMDGLIPVCVQDAQSMQVLMIAFMNAEALRVTIDTGKVTLFSRTKQRLWTKGELSGNYLNVVTLSLDCDKDSLLIYVKPNGPTCHTGATSCFPGDLPPLYWLWFLKNVVAERVKEGTQNSYTNELITSGIPKIAQKIGEEGVEVALAAITGTADELANETVDLLYHIMVLLQAKQIEFSTLAKIISERSQK